MKLILAYVVVVALSQFCLTAGVLAAFPVALVLFWIPSVVRAPLCAFLGGIAGSVCAVGFGYVTFWWLIGPGSFGIFPFIAATLPLSIPIYNDFKKARTLGNLRHTMPPSVAAFTAGETYGSMTMVPGELVGIAVAAVIFL